MSKQKGIETPIQPNSPNNHMTLKVSMPPLNLHRGQPDGSLMEDPKAQDPMKSFLDSPPHLAQKDNRMHCFQLW